MKRTLLLIICLLSLAKARGQDKIYYISDSLCIKKTLPEYLPYKKQLHSDTSYIVTDTLYFNSESLHTKKAISYMAHFHLDTLYFAPEANKSGWTIIYYDHLSKVIYSKKRPWLNDTLIEMGWYRDGKQKVVDTSFNNPIYYIRTDWLPNGNMFVHAYMINDSILYHDQYYRSGSLKERDVANAKGKLAKVNTMEFELQRNSWWKNGQLKSSDSMYYAIRHEHIGYYPNGARSEEFGLIGWRVQIGKYLVWHDNGQLATEGQFKEKSLQQLIESPNSECEGEWKYYDREGHQIKTETYYLNPDTVQFWSGRPTSKHTMHKPAKFIAHYFSGYSEKTDPFILNREYYKNDQSIEMEDDE